MQFDTTYLTEAGRSLATGTLGGLDKIQFTRAVASSRDYSATPVNDLKKLTSIEDVQQTVDYSRIIKKDDTTLTMRVDFPSKDVTTAYSLYTVGFYARPENGDEILYGVLPSSLPDYIAAYDGKSNLNDSFQTDTTVSDADNVLITVSQAGSLNEADLDAIFASKHIATIDDIKANIPATVIDGSKPADFKESVTLEKGAVDGAGNSYVTDDQAVLKTDMRKPANDVAGIEEVNAKQDKIGYTPADDSKVVHNSGNEEIAGQKTFDTAPIDKTTGNPYITKDGVPAVPSTLADTTKDANFTGKLQKSGIDVATKSDITTAVSTATANMVDSTKATNFTAGLQSGGVNVATAADLKSVEASAWKLLVNSDATTAFYRLVNGILYISGYARVGGNYGKTDANLKIVNKLPTELQNKVWTIEKEMTAGLNSGNYDMTAKLSFGGDSSLTVISSVTAWTTDGIVIFNNSYTQG